MGIEAPSISKVPLRKLDSTSSERITREFQAFLRAIRAEELDRQRLYENFKMYWGVDYGQWDYRIVQKLLDENRHPITINLLSQKIQTLAGALSSNQFDVDFVPIDGKNSSLTLGFKDIYRSDKHFMKWDKSYLRCALYGLIYRGDEQLYEDEQYSTHLRFRILQPGHVVYTPDWKTDFSEDCDEAWVFSYMSIEQIAKKYNVHTDWIKNELKTRAMIGPEYERTFVDLGRNVTGKYKNLYRVIETHRMHEVKTKRLIDYSKGINGLAFPVMDIEKNGDYLRAWGEANNVDWLRVKEVPYTDRILKLYTFCPEISYNKAFEDRPSRIQTKRLDLFPWGADRMNGKWRGVVDVCRDVQQNLNKHQSQKTHMINSAANGMTLFNSNLTNGDAAKLNRIKENKNNPAFVEDVDLDDVNKTHVVIKDNPYDPALFNNEKLMIDLFDLVTPVPAAMSSRTEGTKESGVLYQSKIAVAEVGMKVLYDGLKQHQLDKAQAYYLQAQNTYRDKYMVFEKPNRTGRIEINRRINTMGGPVIINDISALPRVNVIIKEDPNGMINRYMNRVMYTEMLNTMPPEMGLARAWLTTKIARTMDMNDEEKAEWDVVTKFEMAKAMNAFKTEMLNMSANQEQAELMIAQMNMQMQQMMGSLGMGEQQATLPQQETPESEIPVSPETGPPPQAGMQETGGPNLQEAGVGVIQE